MNGLELQTALRDIDGVIERVDIAGREAYTESDFARARGLAGKSLGGGVGSDARLGRATNRLELWPLLSQNVSSRRYAPRGRS